MLKRTGIALMLVAGLLWSSSALAGSWEQFKSEQYGFSMLVPPGTKLASKNVGAGWGAVGAKTGAATMLGIAKLGTFSKAGEIEAFGVGVTGIAGKHWKVIDQGKANGWSWYKTAVATDGTDIVAAVYGNGPRGSYLLLIKTTVADYRANEAAYEHWYKNLRVF